MAAAAAARASTSSCSSAAVAVAPEIRWNCCVALNFHSDHWEGKAWAGNRIGEVGGKGMGGRGWAGEMSGRVWAGEMSGRGWMSGRGEACVWGKGWRGGEGGVREWVGRGGGEGVWGG